MTTTGNGPLPPSGVKSHPRTVSPPLLNSMAGLIEAGGARIAPEHDHGHVARVVEPVVLVLRCEDDLAGPELDVGIAHARDAVAGDQVLPLLRVRVPVDVV